MTQIGQLQNISGAVKSAPLNQNFIDIKAAHNDTDSALTALGDAVPQKTASNPYNLSAFSSLTNAFASGESFKIPNGIYDVTELECSASDIVIQTDGDVTFRNLEDTFTLHLNGCDNVHFSDRIKFLGNNQANQKGLITTGVKRLYLENLYFDSLNIGIDQVSTVRQTLNAYSIFVPSYLKNCRFEKCGTGINGQINSEYWKILGNVVQGNTGYGIRIAGGNNNVDFNTALDNSVGLWIDGATLPVGTGTISTISGSKNVAGTGTAFLSELKAGMTITFAGETKTVSTISSDTALVLTANATNTSTNVVFIGDSNSDHSSCNNNTINHNQKCGLYLSNLHIAHSVMANEIWANGGAAYEFESYGNSFGVFLKNTQNVKMVGNSFGVNYVNLGTDGWAMTNASSNVFIGSPFGTKSHIKEYGYANKTYGKNYRNFLNNNSFDGALKDSNTKIIETLEDGNSESYIGTNNVGRTAGDPFKLLTATTTTDYVINKNHKEIIVTSEYTHSLSVSPVMYLQNFDVTFNQKAAGANINITFPTGATLTVLTPLATVASNVITLTANGTYKFVAIDENKWMVTSNSKSELKQAPTLINSWANSGTSYSKFYKTSTGEVKLEGAITGGTAATNAFVLPTGYRPAYNKTFAVSSHTGAALATSYITVKTDGNIYIDTYAGSWISLEQISFKIDA